MSASLRRFLSTIKNKLPVVGSAETPIELEVEQGYRLWAPSYGLTDPTLLDLEEELRHRLQPAAKGLSVLDLGCGRGRSSKLAIESNAKHCTGIDPTLGMLAEPVPEARALMRVAARAGALPFATGSFDLVLSALVLGHLAPLLPILIDVRRVLRPDGRFVLTVFHPAATERGWLRTFRDESTGHTYSISTQTRDPESYRSALSHAGFEIENEDEVEWQGQPVVLGLLARAQ